MFIPSIHKSRALKELFDGASSLMLIEKLIIMSRTVTTRAILGLVLYVMSKGFKVRGCTNRPGTRSTGMRNDTQEATTRIILGK